MRVADDDDYDGSPEARCIRALDNRSLLATITADSTGPEILALTDKLAAKWFIERDELVDLDELALLVDKRRQWELDRKNDRQSSEPGR